MSRFFVDATQIDGSNIHITNKSDVNHLKNVLRAAIGEEIDVSDSKCWEYTAIVDELRHDRVSLKIVDKRRFAREPSLRVALYQGIPKSGKMEDIVRKCVELGVNRIVPVHCARSVAGKGDGYDEKLKRLKRVAEEAVKQCGRGIIPELGRPLAFHPAAVEMAGHSLSFFPYENEEMTTIKDFLRRSDGAAGTPSGEGRDAAFMVGPEGGFADDEAAFLVSLGCVPVSLGRTVLRTETAAPATLAMLMYELEL
jgi:16S rRNA (uracil1498-N3)-methyltransferase